MVFPKMLETYRLPLASKARAVGPSTPVMAKLPRSAPVGENCPMVLPPWLATNRSARADALARLRAIKRLPIVKGKQVLEEWSISVAPFERAEDVGRASLCKAQFVKTAIVVFVR